MRTNAPAACTAAAMAGTSWTSNESEPGDVGADHRIVIRRLDPVALEHVVAELASGEIYTVGDEHMVTGLKHGQERGRDRRQTGRQQRNAGASRSFEIAQC